LAQSKFHFVQRYID